MRTHTSLAAIIGLTLAAGIAGAADHRDSPLVLNDPAADINDVYTFVNPNNPGELVVALTVSPVANVISRFSDAVEYRVHLGVGDRSVVVTCTFPGSTLVNCNGDGGLNASGQLNRINDGEGMRVWAGLRDDPFFFDLVAFNETRAAVAPRFTNPGNNFFNGLDTLAIVLGIDSATLLNEGESPVVSVYGSTNRIGGTGLNNAFSGSWHDAANPGQGILAQVLGPETQGGPDRFNVAWFLNRPDGSVFWVVGTGPIQGNVATVPMYYTEGGTFPPPFTDGQISVQPFGEVEFEFSSCAEGVMRYTSELPEFGSGELPLDRLSVIKDLPCALLVDGQIDRMGRPGVNTALIDLLTSTGKKDAYNRAENPADWTGFTAEIEANLTALDTLDGTTGNSVLPPAALAPVLANDRLLVNTAVPACDAYLAVELGITDQCGGRTLDRDVIDDTLGAIVGPGVGDGVADDSDDLDDFPFLGLPNG